MLHEIDLSRVDLNLLVLFEAVFEERHVGRAASRLHLSASAVSHGIGRLRRALSDPVFLKHPKGVVPTARAAELAAPVADILARVRAVVSVALPFEPRESTRRFAIGAPDAIATVVLPPVLAALRRKAPGVVVNVTEVEPERDAGGARRSRASTSPAIRSTSCRRASRVGRSTRRTS